MEGDRPGGGGLDLALVGCVVGAVSGAVGGMISVFIEKVYMSPLGRLMGPEAVWGSVRLNLSAGAKLGGIAGLITGGVTAGFASLTMGVMAAAALVVVALVQHRPTADGRPGASRQFVLVTTGGAVSGVLAGFIFISFISMIVGTVQ